MKLSGKSENTGLLKFFYLMLAHCTCAHLAFCMLAAKNNYMICVNIDPCKRIFKSPSFFSLREVISAFVVVTLSPAVDKILRKVDLG